MNQLKTLSLAVLLLFNLILTAQNSGENKIEQIRYKNSLLSVEKRVSDLLDRMTLDEKIGQLLCLQGWEMYSKADDKVTYSEKFKNNIDGKHVGMFWEIGRASCRERV